MELTKERLIIAIASGIAIVVFGLYLFLYRPVMNRLRTSYRECKAIEAEVSQSREAIATLKAKDKAKILVAEEDASIAIDELTRQGKFKGIDFISMTPRKIEKSASLPCSVCPIEMEIESTYEELGTFLGSLDDLEKSLFTVKSFDVIADKTNPRKLQTKVVIDLYIKE